MVPGRRMYVAVLLTLAALAPLAVSAEQASGDTPGGQQPASQLQTSANTASAEELLVKARALAAEGKLREAGESYRAWLEQNAESALFADVLLEAAGEQLSADAAVRLLLELGPQAPDGAKRAACLLQASALLELLGRPEDALAALESPALGPQARLPEVAYRRALLCFRLGRFEAAAEALSAIEESPAASAAGPEGARVDPARVLYLHGRVAAATGRTAEAERCYRQLLEGHAASPILPATLLAYRDLLREVGRAQEAQALQAELLRRFPGSPEAALAAATASGAAGAVAGATAGSAPSGPPPAVTYVPAPMQLLPLSPEGEPVRGSGVGQGSAAGQATGGATVQGSAAAAKAPEAPPVMARVQTGSFRDPENARYMVRDLKALGFAAEVVQKEIGGQLYHRVVVGSAQPLEQAQLLLGRLKEKGYEGVLIFGE
jgi:tetratricopeptide (TPR) repeat protein